MVRETSLEIYEKLTNYFGTCQIDVYRYIKEHPKCTRREIERDIEIPINNITGRVNELMKCGIIHEIGKVQCQVTRNNVNSLAAKESINWEEIEIKKRESKTLAKIENKHIPTIYKLIELTAKKFGGIKNLKKYGHTPTVNGIVSLYEELKDLSPEEEVRHYQTIGDEMIFKVESSTRGIFHDITYNKKTKQIKCTCEDHTHRHRKCKHIKEVVTKYKLEEKTNINK